jgi:hypothetical protein
LFSRAWGGDLFPALQHKYPVDTIRYNIYPYTTQRSKTMLIVGALVGAGLGYLLGMVVTTIDDNPAWVGAFPVGFVLIGTVIGAAVGASG